MNKQYIAKQIDTIVNEYIEFMGLVEFPTYQLQYKEVSLLKADAQGFDSIAQTFYQPMTGQHILSVSSNLLLSKYVVFHEFTHMLDSEMYVHGDKVRYAGLSGYTEYHASQVELAHLLGASSIETIPSFSMSKKITTISGEKSVYQYVHEKYQHAIDLFSRKDFPANIDTLKSAFGVLFNYWGLRSICEMYAADYEEAINNTAFLRYIPTLLFVPLNKLMHGWMDKKQIDSSILLYTNSIFPIIQQYKLI